MKFTYAIFAIFAVATVNLPAVIGMPAVKGELNHQVRVPRCLPTDELTVSYYT